MFSKSSKLFCIGILIGLSLVISACGQLFGEKPPRVVTPDAKIGFETECLAQALPIMKKFMEGTAEANQVGQVWDCFGNGIRAYQRKVKGTNHHEYQAHEIAKFFEVYFLGDTTINKELLAEIMHLKQIFVGGSAQAFTRVELNKLIDFAQEMKRISLYLLPYMKVLAKNWNPSDNPKLEDNVKYFEDANRFIQQAAKDIGDIIAKNDKGYSVRNFLILMQEMEALYKEKWEWLADFENLIPLIEQLKGSLAGGNPSDIAPTEWRRFALLSLRGYVQYLRYYYFIENAENIGGSEIVFIAQSIDDLFSYLGDMVREKPGSLFTDVELYDILVAIQNIFPKFKPSKELISEVMKIKVLFFGGSLTQWTPVDFDNAKSKVVAFRSIVERMFNYAQFYSLKWRPQDLPEAEALQFFQGGERNLFESVEILSKVIETDYDLADIEKLCNAIEKLFPENTDQPSWTSRVKTLLPTLISYKKIALAQNFSKVTKQDWPDLLKFTAKVYSRFLYFNYFVSDREIFSGSGLTSFENLSRKSVELISEMIARREKTGGIIHYSELDDLIDSLSKSKLLPKGLTTTSLKTSLRHLVNHYLQFPKTRLSGHKPLGLGREATQVVNSELDMWIESQRFLEILFTRNAGQSTEQILEALRYAEQTDATRELFHVFSSPLSLGYDQHGLLSISKQSIDYDFSSVSRMNFARMLSRLMIRSYVMDMNRITSYDDGISEEEVNRLFLDIMPPLVELGVIRPGHTEFAKSRFFEANLFTPRADGSAFMSLREGAHLVMMIVSGERIASKVEEFIYKECEVLDSQKPFRFNKRVHLPCVSEIYYKNFASFTAGMPDFKAYLASINKVQFEQLFYNMVRGAGWPPNSEMVATLEDISLIPHIFQYSETVLQRFDQNKDGILDEDDALKAYPTYSQLIRKISNIEVEMINKAAFLYIVNHGDVPDTFSELVDLLKELIKKEFFNKPIGIRTDRSGIAKMFGAISDAIRTPSTRNLNPPKRKWEVQIEQQTFTYSSED